MIAANQEQKNETTYLKIYTELKRIQLKIDCHLEKNKDGDHNGTFYKR